MRDRDLHEHVTNMSDTELEATRRDLATGLGLMTPGNSMYAPATTFLNAVDTELAQRQRRASRQPLAPEAS